MTDNSFFLPGGILDEHHPPSRTDSSDDLLSMAVGFSNTLSSGLHSTSLDGPNNDGHSLTHAGRGLNDNSSLFGNAQPNSRNLNGLNEVRRDIVIETHTAHLKFSQVLARPR